MPSDPIVDRMCLKMSDFKTYSELITIPDYLDRFYYLKLDGSVGRETFGYDRYLNQILYTSYEWRKFRRQVIERDHGCDMAHSDYEVPNRAIVHHMNPITIQDILDRNPAVFDLSNVILVSHITHEAIHYGDESLLQKDPVIRMPNDTCPWRL